MGTGNPTRSGDRGWPSDHFDQAAGGRRRWCHRGTGASIPRKAHSGISADQNLPPTDRDGQRFPPGKQARHVAHSRGSGWRQMPKQKRAPPRTSNRAYSPRFAPPPPLPATTFAANPAPGRIQLGTIAIGGTATQVANREIIIRNAQASPAGSRPQDGVIDPEEGQTRQAARLHRRQAVPPGPDAPRRAVAHSLILRSTAGRRVGRRPAARRRPLVPVQCPMPGPPEGCQCRLPPCTRRQHQPIPAAFSRAIGGNPTPDARLAPPRWRYGPPPPCWALPASSQARRTEAARRRQDTTRSGKPKSMPYG